ncbi:SidA/IucD/PvdA family monooxygenase [uncultured Roseobacter sp.]|uniref:lysine N(6)-hydroxylase/L-ornithine N(5)-oxygenase family protein n=1 Tax=uncultured Roseobacter sp. TaxID=114847 RepID=UPI0026316814|nr:SidA/IucD/PvdA family monooxygenase [uncultured Roseobacter sp.]
MTHDRDSIDLAGIGIGPFNLSLAALADGLPDLTTRFFERKRAFSWHPGLAFDDSTMQTSYLKDLVTPVQPTNRWGFLNFLVEHGRFYDFMAARFDTVSRREFTEYLAWVAGSLPSCRFATAIRDVDHDGQAFRLRTDRGETVTARAIAVGTGPVPHVPEGAPLGPACFHGMEYLERMPQIAGRRVAVIGGGQTGAEIMLDLLGKVDGPAALNWISRRSAFWALQEGGLIDQIYTPAYGKAHQRLPAEVQSRLVEDQKLSSDGLTPSTADALYRLIYQRRYLDCHNGIALRPGQTVKELRGTGGAVQLILQDAVGALDVIHADVVILATGFRTVLPDCLEPLRDRLETEQGGALQLGAAYRVVWDGPDDAGIYGLNHGRRSYGIGDPQLSLTAWRSATILEDVTGQRLFPALHGPQGGLVDWTRSASGREMRISA